MSCLHLGKQLLQPNSTIKASTEIFTDTLYSTTISTTFNTF